MYLLLDLDNTVSRAYVFQVEYTLPGICLVCQTEWRRVRTCRVAPTGEYFGATISDPRFVAYTQQNMQMPAISESGDVLRYLFREIDDNIVTRRVATLSTVLAEASKRLVFGVTYPSILGAMHQVVVFHCYP